MCDILIITSAFGNGHLSVANAIKEQLQEQNANFKIEIDDVMDMASSKTKEVYFDIYTLLTSQYPDIYNFFYKIKKDMPNNGIDYLMYSLYMKKVARHIKEKNPSLIVSTFPLGSGFVSKIKEYYGISVPLVTTITDVADSWEWIHHKTDMYFVPCNYIAECLMEKGISKEKIRVTGIPVKKEFLENNDTKRSSIQVLIMGSVMDELGLNRQTVMELDKLSHIKIIVVTGKNYELYDELTYNITLKNVEVLGYANNVAELMESSDLIITKPGGVTLFEAINKGIPVILKNSFVAQEESNIEFMKSMGIDLFIDENMSLKDQILHALSNLDKLNHMREKFHEIRMQINPTKIGEYVMELM